jgi:effector-binding domain-containing protein
MIDTPRIVDTPAMAVAFIPVVVPRPQIREVMGPGIAEVLAAIAAQGQTPAGPWLTHHLRVDPEVFDFRICVPVAEAIRPVGRVQAGELAAARVAQTVYLGPYEGLAEAWPEFRAWTATAGLTMREDIWERYVVGPESSDDPAQWCTELNWPLAGPEAVSATEGARQ